MRPGSVSRKGFHLRRCHADPEPLERAELGFSGQRLRGFALEQGMAFLALNPTRKHQKSCSRTEQENGGKNQQDHDGQSRVAACGAHGPTIRHHPAILGKGAESARAATSGLAHRRLYGTII